MTAEAEDPTRKRTLLDALYRKYNAALRAFLARHRLNRDEVADIVQETYFRVHQAGTVADIRNPKAFLTRVANNVRINEQKLRRRSIEHGTIDIESVEIASAEPTPYRSLKGEQELAAVHGALEELAPKCRDAFLMNRFENMTFAQIAAELDLSVSMIEKHVSHAIAHLRKRLEEKRRSADPQPLHLHKHRDVSPK